MMKIQNLGSKESVGVRFKEGTCAKLYLKLLFESNWYFCNITKSGWFWKRLSRKKVPNNHFLKSLQKQPYADVLQKFKFPNIHRNTSVLESLFNRCFLFSVAKFFQTAFSIDHLRWHLSIFFFFSKTMCSRVRYLVLVETISTRFYWLTCRIQETCPK